MKFLRCFRHSWGALPLLHFSSMLHFCICCNLRSKPVGFKQPECSCNLTAYCDCNWCTHLFFCPLGHSKICLADLWCRFCNRILTNNRIVGPYMEPLPYWLWLIIVSRHSHLLSSVWIHKVRELSLVTCRSHYHSLSTCPDTIDANLVVAQCANKILLKYLWTGGGCGTMGLPNTGGCTCVVYIRLLHIRWGK